MGTPGIIIISILCIYIVLRLTFRVMYPGRDPHKMRSFWLILFAAIILFVGGSLFYLLHWLNGIHRE
jgi:Sec-independent protein secretion pathway component TatC